MSSIRDTFTPSLYATACFGAVMLALAETGVPLSALLGMASVGAVARLFPAILTIPVAFAAYHFVEKRRLNIPNWVSNVMGVVALLAALSQLWIHREEGRLLFGAHLLVYLTWILLWQPKAGRQRWGLMALALLQVAVGSVLTTAGWYGAALVMFLALMLWTLILLQISNAEDRLDSASHETTSEAVSSDFSSLRMTGRVRPLGHATVSYWPTRTLLTTVAMTLAGSLAIGAVFFLFVPRVDFGMSAFEQGTESLGNRRITGFTDRVRLGSFSQILESIAPAFQIELTSADGESLDVNEYASTLGMDEPLFRGLSLSDYEAGEWRAESSRFDRVSLRQSAYPNTITQKYYMQMEETPVLFGLMPVVGGKIEGSDRTIQQADQSRALYPGNGSSRRESQHLIYELYSPPSPEHSRAVFHNRILSIDRERYLSVPSELDRLAAIARVNVGNGNTDRERADQLVAYLRDSGQFEYSLKGDIIDPKMDPIEDFLLNRKSGHCEYFASALALMLRSEGIPARVVNGYKGGEVDRLIRRFEVQQRHAHAWVEAYIDDEWVTLDPSPAEGRRSIVRSNAPQVPVWSNLIASSTTIWRDYIVQLNINRQRQALSPLRDATILLFRTARDVWWPAIKSHTYAFATEPERWFSWQGGIVSFVVLLFVVLGWKLSQRVAKRLRKGRRGSGDEDDGRLLVDFYDDFLRLCRHNGWIGKPTQTPKEFAHVVQGNLTAYPGTNELQAFPEELTYDYYQIRFGATELPDGRREHLRQQLAKLKSSMSKKADPS